MKRLFMNNRFTMDGGVKRLVCTLKRQEFYIFVDCVISAVTYENKGHKLWSEIPKASCRMVHPKIQRDVSGNTNLYKVCCDHYRQFYIYACH